MEFFEPAECGACWVCSLVAVFRECRRVLADHGVMFVEIGDSYVSGQGGRQTSVGEMPAKALSLTSDGDVGRDDVDTGSWRSGATSKVTPARGTTDLKPKDLLGQPWLLAFALRADGWYLRSEIIWARPNPMPESVRDRPTKAHSTVFLLSKRPSYYYDQDAIREEYRTTAMPGRKVQETHHYGAGNGGNGGLTDQLAAVRDRLREQNRPQVETLDGSEGEAPRGPDGRRVTAVKGGDNSEQHRDGERWPNPSGANARSVWTIPTEPTPFAHFATFPRELVRRMILAGTSERGKCPECGKPWVRETERELAETNRTSPPNKGHVGQYTGERAAALTAGGWVPNRDLSVRTLGWSPSCACGEYVCPACDNELDHDSRTTSMSGVRDAVRPEGSPQETEVLLSGVRERRQDEADADVDVRGMRQAVLAQDTEHEAGAVLLEDVRESRDGPEPAVDQGIRDRREGLSADPRSWSSDGEPRGVRDGTPPSDVRTTGADADAGRGSPSPERGEGRQPSGEPSGYSEGSARSNAEAAQDNDRVSALRRDDQDVQRCADCGTALEHRPHHPRPAVVLDVFAGSGTTLYVARKLGRHAVGIELNENYCRIAADRLAQQSLLA